MFRLKNRRVSITSLGALCALAFQSVPAWAVPITGGTGPGGFEQTSGASSLLMWFKADSLSLSDGAAIPTWTNSTAAAGAASSATQGTAAQRPTFQNGAGDLINGLPVVRFDGTDDNINGSVTIGLDKTFFSVVKDTGTTGTCCSGGVATRTTGSSNFNGLHSVANGGTQKFFADRSGSGLTGTASIAGVPVIGTLTYASTGTAIFLNGGLDASNASDFRSTGTSFQLGARNNQLGRYLRGDMAESGVFNRVLNSAERQIVENSLSSKYNIALSTGDVYTGDTAGNGDYDRDVFGIGRVNSANQVLSAGSAGFGIEATSGIADDGDFALAGHATAVNSLTMDDVPSSVRERWSRVWFVDVTDADNDLAATMHFDFSDAGLAAPTLLDQPFTLLYSPNSTLDFSVVALTPVLTGDRVSFSLGNADLQDGYFTLGLGLVAIPEPTTVALCGLSMLAMLRRRRSLL